MHRQLAICGALILAAGASAADQGGWRQQSIPLQMGWNLVWLEVDPTPPDVGTVFADLISAGVLESVWSFAPSIPGTGPGTWLVYAPQAPTYVNTLSVLSGGRGLFVKVNSPPTQPLTITGHPTARKHTLSFQGALLGAPTSGPGVTFRSFFAFGDVDDKIAAGGAIHRFDPNAALPQNEYVLVGLDTIGGLMPNTSYWVSIEETFSYAGPLRVGGAQAGCQFGAAGYIETVTIEVPVSTTGPQIVTVRALDSATPPAGEPADAGGPSAWLQYRDAGGEWAFIPPAGVPLTIPTGQATASIDLRARRKDLAQASVEDNGMLYQAILEVAGTAGNVIRLSAGMEKPSAIGTWTGVVELNNVGLHSLVVNDPKGTTAANTMRFAVVVEVPQSGSPRLLNRACMAVARDGATMNYAYEAVLFPHPIVLSGNLETGAAGTWQMAADHPLNPYRHRYNPKHRDGYAITRDITLTIDDKAVLDPDLPPQISDTIQNNTLLGNYIEVVSGLSPEPIVLSGTFRLRRLSRDTGLNGLCVCGLPGTGKPWQANGIAGCDDASCCALVCEINPACCDIGWDAICVQIACQNCTNPELQNQPACNP